MKSIAQLLTSDTLKSYITKIDQLTYLNEAWLRIVENEWASQCQIINYEQGSLTLGVSNASLATRVRYILPDIFGRLAKHDEFSRLKEIKCKIIT